MCAIFHIKELSDTIDLSEGDTVLDVACGNGTLLRELSKKTEIHANGIDVSENMICAAKMRYPNMNFAVRQFFISLDLKQYRLIEKVKDCFLKLRSNSRE